ncbi:MAG: hypothetical protein HOW73_36850 [Polyangiaceae bacterium]|nr:hypothetical protein [Polyangiaceae bacterium]
MKKLRYRPTAPPQSGWLALILTLVACDGAAGTSTPDDGNETCDGGNGGGSAQPPREEPDDELTPLRLLRRSSIVLVGAPPTVGQLAEITALSDEAARFAYVDEFIDAAMEDPRFYRLSFEHAQKWMNIPLIENTADEPEYGPKQQRLVVPCPDGTALAGAAMYYWRANPDSECAAGAPTIDVEPWWEPGTTLKLAGAAANTTNEGIENINGNPVEVQCDGVPRGTCGCGNNAIGCWTGTTSGYLPFIAGNPKGQRRLLAEEPARLYAHIVWQDRPLTDLVLADYSVGPTELQSAYIRQGIAGGALELQHDDTWWNPATMGSPPVDPEHEGTDAWAWREYTISARNPFFLAERDYKFDPRAEAGPSRGFPSAGALTSLGFLDAYPRERLRAARALEVFACEELLPPAAIEFNPYETDPGREGPCQHCHTRIDTAALHFKRFAKRGSAFEGWGASYYMPGVGEKWQWDPVWRTGEYPYGVEPFAQWNKWYRPGSLMTPATEAEAEENPYALFLDFLPPEETLLGQHGDGTVGPLGFAKLIVAAGAFDRCMVRRMHDRILGRDLDPTTEAAYIQTLADEFVEGGRLVRPFIRSLMQSTYFRRGL